MCMQRLPNTVDLFCGGGGASEGIRRATGRCPVIAINHDAHAIAMHEANHPHTIHFNKSVHDVTPLVAAGIRVDLLWLSPDCFPAGTLVLTRQGYRPIEDIQVDDEVLTHQGRWRRVTSTMKTRKSTRVLKGYGHPGLQVSNEHPFWTVKRTNVWNNSRRAYDRTFGGDGWTPVKDIEPWATGTGGMPEGHLWATPKAFPPCGGIPAVGGRGMQVDRDLLWLAGLYVADGWTRITRTRAELVITCGHHETAQRRTQLARWPRTGSRAGFNQLAWAERDTATARQFSTNHRGLVLWLREHFGHLAPNKSLPPWLLGLPAEDRRAFLDGYMAGDGGVYSTGDSPDRADVFAATTVSKALAFSIRHLATSLGAVVGVYRREENGNGEIDGRPVSTLPAYAVRWRRTLDPAHREHYEDTVFQYTAVRASTESTVETVYNISVEEDESYIVEGLVVHNCTHHSRARGGKPRRKEFRDLPWVAMPWLDEVEPAMLMLENVPEFVDWGPLYPADHPVVKLRNRPIKERRGETFREYVHALEAREYTVEWRTLRACDYGAPTTRQRLFICARRDGKPIVWPEPTHGPGTAQPYRTAAECIDWDVPICSIFASKAEAKAWAKKWKKLRPDVVNGTPKRPLADKTQRRIAEGLRRFVIESTEPFLLHLTHGGRLNPIHKPIATVTAANRGEQAVVAPYIAKLKGTSEAHLATGGESVEAPLSTLTAGGRHHGVVVPYLATLDHQSSSDKSATRGADEPLSTITTKARHLVMAPLLVQTGYGEREGQRPRALDLHAPLGTIVASGGKHALVAAWFAKHNGKTTGQAADVPLHAITGRDTKSLVTAQLEALGPENAERAKLVAAFIVKYYGEGSQWQDVNHPLHTIVTKARFGLVTVTIDGEDYAIVDIGMRMLTPRELARCQGFTDDYVLTGTVTEQIARIGNSVPPQFAEAMVRANFATLDLDDGDGDEPDPRDAYPDDVNALAAK